MLRCIKRLVVDVLGPILGLIGEDGAENPALAKRLSTSTPRQRSGNAEAVNDSTVYYIVVTIFYTAMQGSRRIMKKPHDFSGNE